MRSKILNFSVLLTVTMRYSAGFFIPLKKHMFSTGWSNWVSHKGQQKLGTNPIFPWLKFNKDHWKCADEKAEKRVLFPVLRHLLIVVNEGLTSRN
jgi:hypothetical protein